MHEEILIGSYLVEKLPKDAGSHRWAVWYFGRQANMGVTRLTLSRFKTPGEALQFAHDQNNRECAFLCANRN